MRSQPRVLLAVSALLLMAGLAGCIGGGGDVDGPNVPDVEEMPTLPTQIRTGFPRDTWFEPGTVIDVEGVVLDAVGEVTYHWAMQPNRWTDFFDQPYYNTSTMLPGDRVEITFQEPGFHDMGHCHYHPLQGHTVAVLEGVEPPEEPIVVYALEGELGQDDTYSFAPGHITIPPGTTVTYVNAGRIQHTMSIHDWPTPQPDLLPLDGPTGQVTLDRFTGDWVDLLLFVHDEAGNGGYAVQPLYVRDRFDTFNDTVGGMFSLAHDELNEDLEELDELVESRNVTRDFTFEWNGELTLNVDMVGAHGALNTIEVAFYEIDRQGQWTRPVINWTVTGSGALSETIETRIERDYQLAVRPAEGVGTEWEIEVVFEYDHTPPDIDVGTPCPEPHYSLGHC